MPSEQGSRAGGGSPDRQLELSDDAIRQTIRLEELRKRALAEGRRIARKVFAKRGNHSEAHLSEVELACMLTVAYEAGSGERCPSSPAKEGDRGR